MEMLGYPAGGDSLCVTKGVVSRIEIQEYAQVGVRLLVMRASPPSPIPPPVSLLLLRPLLQQSTADLYL
jgi:hypothetical protein